MHIYLCEVEYIHVQCTFNVVYLIYPTYLILLAIWILFPLSIYIINGGNRISKSFVGDICQNNNLDKYYVKRTR
jgi:hypothetical protein